MEGALRPCALLFLLLVSQLAEHGGADAGAMELSGILGGSVTFPLGIPAEQFISVAWTVNQTNPVVSAGAGNPPDVLVLDSSYEERLRVSAGSYSLQLTDLRMEDMGTYRAQIILAGAVIHRQFSLRMYRRVPEPTILCGLVTCGNASCDYSLTCTVRDGGANVTYRWTQPEKGASVINESVLLIQTAPRTLTCTAQNPVSTSSRTASAEDFCPANLPAPASRTSLSYCRVKGLILLLVLAALSAGIIAVHVLPGGGQRRG